MMLVNVRAQARPPLNNYTSSGEPMQQQVLTIASVG